MRYRRGGRLLCSQEMNGSKVVNSDEECYETSGSYVRCIDGELLMNDRQKMVKAVHV